MRISHFLSCVHCLCSCHYAPARRAWAHVLCTLLIGICRQHLEPPFTFPSPGWTTPGLPASPHTLCSSHAAILLTLFWTHSAPVCPHLPCTGEPQTGCNTPEVVSQVQNRREGSFFSWHKVYIPWDTREIPFSVCVPVSCLWNRAIPVPQVFCPYKFWCAQIMQ